MQSFLTDNIENQSIIEEAEEGSSEDYFNNGEFRAQLEANRRLVRDHSALNRSEKQDMSPNRSNNRPYLDNPYNEDDSQLSKNSYECQL